VENASLLFTFPQESNAFSCLYYLLDSFDDSIWMDLFDTMLLSIKCEMGLKLVLFFNVVFFSVKIDWQVGNWVGLKFLLLLSLFWRNKPFFDQDIASFSIMVLE
jgi:hypothetical protein